MHLNKSTGKHQSCCWLNDLCQKFPFHHQAFSLLKYENYKIKRIIKNCFLSFKNTKNLVIFRNWQEKNVKKEQSMALFIIFLQWIIKLILCENTTDIYFILFFIIIRSNTKYIKIKKRRKKEKKRKKISTKAFLEKTLQLEILLPDRILLVILYFLKIITFKISYYWAKPRTHSFCNMINAFLFLHSLFSMDHISLPSPHFDIRNYLHLQ